MEEFLENFDEKRQIKFKGTDENRVKIDIIERANVGKSNLLDALMKEQRSIVSSIAGTTIGSINESVVYKDEFLEFVDTAGIRRRGKAQELERFTLNHIEKMLENPQIALLVLGVDKGFNEFDECTAGLINKHYLGVITVLNKWDKMCYEFDKVVKELGFDCFRLLAHAPIIGTLTLSGKRVYTLMDRILETLVSFT